MTRVPLVAYDGRRRCKRFPGGLLLLLVVAYFLPALIAYLRGHHQRIPIMLTNLFFGWTLLGWAVALIWSYSATKQG